MESMSIAGDGKRRGIAPAARPAQPVPLAPSICIRMYTQARAGLVQALRFPRPLVVSCAGSRWLSASFAVSCLLAHAFVALCHNRFPTQLH